MTTNAIVRYFSMTSRTICALNFSEYFAAGMGYILSSRIEENALVEKHHALHPLPRKIVRSGPVKVVSGTSRSRVTGCVGTPIIGRPRPLSSATTYPPPSTDRSIDSAYCTLKSEEPIIPSPTPPTTPPTPRNQPLKDRGQQARPTRDQIATHRLRSLWTIKVRS